MLEIFKFIFKTRKFWLLPLVCALVLVGAFFVLTNSSALAPMIYAIF